MTMSMLRKALPCCCDCGATKSSSLTTAPMRSRFWRQRIRRLSFWISAYSGSTVTRSPDAFAANPAYESTVLVAVTGYGQESDHLRSQALRVRPPSHETDAPEQAHGNRGDATAGRTGLTCSINRKVASPAPLAPVRAAGSGGCRRSCPGRCRRRGRSWPAARRGGPGPCAGLEPVLSDSPWTWPRLMPAPATTAV